MRLDRTLSNVKERTALCSVGLLQYSLTYRPVLEYHKLLSASTALL